MGNENNSIKVNKKLLILTFEEYYTNKMYSHLSTKNLFDKISSDGFVNEIINYSNNRVSIWFLSPENRHLWKHYYMGTQGVIIVFSFQNAKTDSGVIIETLNIIFDSFIKRAPILILFDKDYVFFQSDLMKQLEQIVESNSKDKINYYFNLIDFGSPILKGINRGFDWIIKQMNNV